jgi:hypothetical protein
MLLQKLGRVPKWAPLAVALLVLMPAGASADILTFYHTGSGSGTLDDVPFATSDYVITATGDTDDRQGDSVTWWIDHTSASISIAGLGEFDFASGTRTFVNNDNERVGFSRAGHYGMDLTWGPTDAAFATWEMLTAIGPIAGEVELMQWSLWPWVETSGGTLVFDDDTCDGTFEAVPEPTTLALFGALALIARRRR